ncbi:alpha-glucuronidase [Novosphingobium umbonatum]|uniref:Xylan alpha-1,2-glucuronidase n=2 Tax=Novosphingobium umbonatum TaxID=1908524 RepID=A0A3S2V7Y9_9SPHN|nr:alpha-glucuronidase [Novosphingobium umbonatum]
MPQTVAHAEDGHELWLRASPLPAPQRSALRHQATRLQTTAHGPTARLALAELQRGLARLGATPARGGKGGTITLELVQDSRINDEGFHITARPDGQTVIAARREIGLLYGVFHYLRLAATGAPLATLDLASSPRVQLRVLNHWDNLDGVVERGYSGRSIWDWWRLPDWRDTLYTEYARANASLGINGVVVNNVNAKSTSLTAPYIAKLAAIAGELRPWGIRVYLSARWTAPMEIGGLKSADPLDPAVAAWWRAKSDEIYAAIPDFGGFLVKANSEGQPGPQDYRRSHAEGANMLAAAVKPHGGVVMWRAFVYAHDNPDDRAKQAYNDFQPLDGQFADNVLVQVKNGAIDFQPREPFHPLFGAMPKTNLMMEFQITKEYVGQSTHLTYLGTLFSETLQADTQAKGTGSTVAKVVDGTLDGHRLTGMAGVANIGADRDWSGSIFNQADWYAFGRLAWDPELSPETIAREWAAQTFGPAPKVVNTVTTIMMPSREAAVDYMTPLGLAHVMGTGHHYGPAPWVSHLARPEWNPVYYHKADAQGIGFDRSAKGSNAISQYAPPIAQKLSDPATTDERQLLWFHHLPWDYRLKNGEALWSGMVHHYDAGVAQVARMQVQWDSLQPYIDKERFAKTQAFLAIQRREAQWWRDASIAYFQSVNHLDLPSGSAKPAHDLDWYKEQNLPYAPGNP